jgi:hypothetical protein
VTVDQKSAAIEMAGKFDRFLDKAIHELNPKGQSMTLPPNTLSDDPIKRNITGASFLGDKFKQDLATAKAEIAAAQTQAGNAIADVKAAAVKTVEMAKAIQAEADDLKASLGQGANDV